MMAILFVLFLIGLTLPVSTAFHQRFEVAFPVALFSAVVVLYIAGLAGNLYAGMIVLFVVFGLGVLLTAYWVLVRHRGGELRTLVLVPGLAVFVVIALGTYVVTRHLPLTQWDDFSHWGPMIKESFYIGQFYNVSQSPLVMHRDYPPALMLSEYLACRTFGSYTVGAAYLGHTLVGLACLLPSLAKTSWRQGHRIAVIAFAILVVPAIFSAFYYRSLYVDVTLGLLFGYGVSTAVMARRGRAFTTAGLALTCFMLVLTKQTGVVLAGLLVLLRVGLAWFPDSLPAPSESPRVRGAGLLTWIRDRTRYWTTAGVMIASTVMAYGSWKLVLHVNEVTGQQFQGISVPIGSVIKVLLRQGDPYQMGILDKFLGAVFSWPLMSAPISFSYVTLTVVLSGVLVVFGALVRRTLERRRLFWVASILCIGAIIYAIALMLTYVFLFGDIEGPGLASFDRYMGTYLVGMIVAVVIIIPNSMSLLRRRSRLQAGCSALKELPQGGAARRRGLIASIAVFALFSTYLPGIVPNAVLNRADDPGAFMAGAYDKLAAKVDDADIQHVYWILQNTVGFEYWPLRYHVLPGSLALNPYYSIGEPYSVGDIWTHRYTPDEWASELTTAGYRYVYVDDGRKVRQF